MKISFERVHTVDGIGEVLVFHIHTKPSRYGMISMDKRWINLNVTNFKWSEMWYGYNDKGNCWLCSLPEGRIGEVPNSIVQLVDDYLFEKEFLCQK